VYKEYRVLLAKKDKKAKGKLESLAKIEATLGFDYISLQRKMVIKEIEYDMAMET
jgi:hypothetical protein